ncbi:MAG: hypothetical protein AMJ79_11595 [Phycisphaerae bacterium SM23_30]|nr:MAG: hypothetical protein AMJ79_11595 [Phycisphaerae bacterium SM23_30]
MSTKLPANLPGALSAASQRFHRWRKQHRSRARLPQELWRRAAALARKHGLHLTARALGLNYYSLQRRLAETAPEEVFPTKAQQAFIELLPEVMAPGSVECTIEWVEGGGATVRMHIQGARLPELTYLVRVLRGGAA